MAAKKRTPTEIVRDRELISELRLRKHTHAEIAKILKEERGIVISPRMISYDLNQVRKEWRKATLSNYHMLMMEELARIDSLEAAIWQALRDSTGIKRTEVVDRAMRRVNESDDDDVEMVISKVKETLEDLAPSPAYFSQIQDCQRERRKLLGLYAPQQIGVEKTVIVKGYASVSPDDWPDVIEGEVIS